MTRNNDLPITKRKVIKSHCHGCGKPVYIRGPRAVTAEHGIMHRKCADEGGYTRNGVKRGVEIVAKAPAKISVEDLERVLGEIAARQLIEKVLLAKLEPLTQEQLDTFIDLVEGRRGKGQQAALPALYRFCIDRPRSAKAMAQWARDAKDHGGVTSGMTNGSA